MNRYQAGISEFTENDSLVFGVSTDPLSKNKEFAESLNLEFPLLSDEGGKVTGEYGILMDEYPVAKRVTFVVGRDRKIAYVAEGKEAMDPTAAASACGKLR